MVESRTNLKWWETVLIWFPLADRLVKLGKYASAAGNCGFEYAVIEDTRPCVTPLTHQCTLGLVEVDRSDRSRRDNVGRER